MALRYEKAVKEYLNSRGMLLTAGELTGLRHEFKFGHNPAVGTSYAVISEGGLYRTPTPSNAVELRVKAGGAAGDTLEGIGARRVRLFGIDETGAQIAENIDLAGVSASASTSQMFMRLWRVLVIETGVYSGNMLGGGQLSTITIEDTTGTEDWAMVQVNGFAAAQTQIGAYSFGTGERGYLLGGNIFVDSNKVVDFLVVYRGNFMNESVFSPVTLATQMTGIEGSFTFVLPEAVRFFEHSDLAILARVPAGTAAVSMQMTLVMNRNGNPAGP